MLGPSSVLILAYGNCIKGIGDHNIVWQTSDYRPDQPPKCSLQQSHQKRDARNSFLVAKQPEISPALRGVTSTT